jgi:hypothetical protein
MFLHHNIHKYTFTTPDGKTHNQINCILIDMRRHSNILDVGSYRAADCDTTNLVDGNVRERLAANRQRSHRFHMERFNLQKLNEIEGEEQYRNEVSNTFAPLEGLDAEIIRENTNISARESLGYSKLKKQKPWLDEGCTKLIDKRKQAQLQWLLY